MAPAFFVYYCSLTSPVVNNGIHWTNVYKCGPETLSGENRMGNLGKWVSVVGHFSGRIGRK